MRASAVLSLSSAIFATLAFATPSSAQIVGSSTYITHRSCAATPAGDPCDGAIPSQYPITRQYGGGIGVAGYTGLDIGGGNFAWSNVAFDGALDLPTLRGASSAAGDVRMNVNSYALQSYLYGGPTAAAFSLSGDLHIVNSSTNPAGGTLPNGALYSQYLAVWDPSIIAGLNTGEELFNALFYADCSTPGVLGMALGSGSLPGGEQTYSLTTTECAAGSLLLAPGQEVLVVAGFQLPVNRGGFADASGTFVTRLGDNLSASEQSTLTTYLESAIDRGATVNSVPEPASWAMMIIGMFGIGLGMRRAPRSRLAFA